MNNKNKKLLNTLWILLLVGTVFAWSVLTYEIFNWIKGLTCNLGCPMPNANPFLTPCFGGAVMFLTSFVICNKLKANNK